MIATGNHGNSDSLRGAPLPAVQCSDLLSISAKTYRVLGRHECLPYSKDGTCLEIYKHQFVVQLMKADNLSTSLSVGSEGINISRAGEKVA